LQKILDIPVSWFFEGLPPTTSLPAGFAEGGQESLDGVPAAIDPQLFQRRETLELIRAYYRVSDPKKRRKVYELIKSMAEEGE
jgi:hypothetical protein